MGLITVLDSSLSLHQKHSLSDTGSLVSLPFQALVQWTAGGKTPDWARWKHASGKWRVSILMEQCTAPCRCGDLKASVLSEVEAWHQAESWFEGRVLEWYATEQAPALSLGKVTPDLSACHAVSTSTFMFWCGSRARSWSESPDQPHQTVVYSGVVSTQSGCGEHWSIWCVLSAHGALSP